jgi:hypothetical protein
MRFSLLRCTAIALGAASLAWPGTVIQLSSRAGLTDSLDWLQLGPGFIAESTPLPVTSGAGNHVTVTVADASLVDKAPSGIWAGLTGDALYTFNNNGPVTLTFANPISKFVTDWAPDYSYVSGSGPLKATITAFNGATNLGSFTVGGDNLPNFTQIVLGVSDTQAEITSIVIDGLVTAPVSPAFPGIVHNHQFAIDGLSLDPAPSVPEPGSAACLCLGLCWLARRRFR